MERGGERVVAEMGETGNWFLAESTELEMKKSLGRYEVDPWEAYKKASQLHI